MTLICATCINFAKRETYNDRLYLGRCTVQKVGVMICPPEEAKESCHDYKVAPDAKEQVAKYKAWREKHPLPVYQLDAQVIDEEAAKQVKKKSKRRKK